MKINEETKTVAFEGEVKWASIPPNKPRGPTGKYLKKENKNNLSYSIDVECTEGEFKQLLSVYNLPPKTKLRKDEDTNKTYIKINCLKRKTNNDPEKNHGQDHLFGDPVVVDAAGKLVTKAAANGSTADVRAKVIDNDGDHSLRLIGVRFLNLIEYTNNPFSDVLDSIEAPNPEGNPYEAAEANSQDLSSGVEDEFGF